MFLDGHLIAIALPAALAAIFGVTAGRYRRQNRALAAELRLQNEPGRCRAEKACAAFAKRKQEARYREVFEHASDALFVVAVDSAGQLVFDSINPAAEAAFGVPAKMLEGTPLADIAEGKLGGNLGGSFADDLKIYLDCMATGLPVAYSGTLDLRPADRFGHRYYHVQVLPLADDTGISRLVCIGHDVTERRLHEAVLRQQARLREQLAAVAEAVPGCLLTFRTTADGRSSFPYTSSGIHELFGVSPDEIRDDAAPLRARTHPDDLPRHFDLVEQSRRDLTPFHNELRIIHPDKGERWIEVRSMPQARSDGSVDWHGLMIDITERKKAETALRERELFLGSLLETIPLPVFYKDTEGRYLGFNTAFEEFFGLTRERLLGRTVFDICPADNAEVFLARDASLFASGGAQQYESQVTNARGLTRDAIFSKATFADAQGLPCGLIGVILDITERKAAEQKLRQTQTRLSALVSTIPDLVWMKDMGGAYISANPAFERFVGAPEDAIVGKTDYDFVDAELADFFRQKDRDAIAADRVCINEEAVTFADGNRPAILETRKVPVRGGDGQVIGVLGIAREITATKEAEWRLKESRDLLEKLAAHREDILEEERKRVARSLHEELGQQLTTLRMDISTLPLEFGDVLKARTQAMLGLVDLTLQGMRNVVTSLRTATLDAGLAAALEWLANDFWRKSGVECRVLLPKNGIDGIADSRATAIFRIVQEALGNVARHAGARRVDIKLRREADGWRLSVCDDGCGFNRQAPTKSAFGLFGMEERGRMMGGELSVVSTPGQGTEVVLVFPG